MNKSYYAIIPANVRYDDELTPNAKLLYGEITALCNEKGYCWATNNYFAELYGVSKTSISKWIKQLIDKGYIKSQIKYHDGTKEIENRYLYIGSIPIEEKLKGCTTNINDPIEEKLNTPIEEKLKDNNTLFNNTSNNTINNNISKDILSSTDIRNIITTWNSISDVSKLKFIDANTNRYKLLKARIKQYGIESVIEDIKNISKSTNIRDGNKRGWVITFDWLIKPNNFPKVLEGNYSDKEGEKNGLYKINISNQAKTEEPKYDFSCFD